VEERYESELAQSTSVLDDVDRALERLTSGAYDSCEVCGAVIPDVLLARDPTRRVCEQHGAVHEAVPGAPDHGLARAEDPPSLPS
jgi:RNA polymerase-binding transcription factor DksA